MASTSLVTGGAGFIGSNLVRALLDDGLTVVVIDDLSTGSEDNLPKSRNLTIIREDLEETDSLVRVLPKCDYVFHLAARVAVMRSIEDPVGDARSNIVATVRLLHACRDTGVKKIVISSSAAPFGEAVTVPIAEDHPQRPESFYALSKMAAEKYAFLAQRLWGLPVVCLRYFNVFGLPAASTEYSGVITAFVERLKANEPLVINGDGSQYRDFVYVRDVVDANRLAAKRASPGAVFNIGTGRPTTVLELAKLLGEIAGRRPEILFQPFRQGEVQRSVADIGLARRDLGYEPRYDLRAGLEEIWGSR